VPERADVFKLTHDPIHFLDIDMNPYSTDDLKAQLEGVADGNNLNEFFPNQPLQARAHGGLRNSDGLGNLGVGYAPIFLEKLDHAAVEWVNGPSAIGPVVFSHCILLLPQQNEFSGSASHAVNLHSETVGYPNSFLISNFEIFLTGCYLNSHFFVKLLFEFVVIGVILLDKRNRLYYGKYGYRARHRNFMPAHILTASRHSSLLLQGFGFRP
jgi:hypothetical protein